MVNREICSYRIVLLLLMVQLMHYETDALSQGFAPRWILDRFCKEKQGLVKVPWNCDGYLHCTSTRYKTSGSWFDCAGILKFDETDQACVPSPKDCLDPPEVASKYCKMDPTLKFPHPRGCALYYDCSQTRQMDTIHLAKYENECPYPELFDPETAECRQDQPNPVKCQNKPTTRCDYRKESNCKPQDTSRLCFAKIDGLHSNPASTAYSPDYISCIRGELVATEQCKTGFVFDPVTSKCSSNISETVREYCRLNPQAIFPDTQNCARFYNCSLAFSYYGLNPYQSECLYTELYETSTRSCVRYDKLLTPCGKRFEPINPCEYKVGHCIGRTYCILCDAQCKGNDDGPHPYPTYPNTRFHLMCEGGRTLRVLRCNEGQIYSHQHRHCISPADINKLPTTTAPEKTTSSADPTTKASGKTTTKATETPTTKLSTPATPTTPTKTPSTESPIFGVCPCMDEINPLAQSLKNLSSFFDTMSFPMQVNQPYDCDEPPRVRYSSVMITYEFDVAVATYKCDDGYSTCGTQLRSTCIHDNMWDRSFVTECVKDTWANMNKVNFPCEVQIDSVVSFTGRSVEDKFTFTLMNNANGQTFLYATVKATLGTVAAGIDSASLTTVKSPVPLTGEVLWIVEFKSSSFEISVNGQHVISVPNTGALSLINTLLLSDAFRAQEVKFFHDGIPTIPSGKHALKANLAVNKLTTASSSYDSSEPSRVVDGYSHVLWGEHSCWAADTTDTKPWLMVDLGKVFYVSYVVLAGVDCQGSSCGMSLMNFNIEVMKDNPQENINAVREVCVDYRDTFLPRQIEKLDCYSDVVGRYVTIRANGVFSDKMTICEVEVYGGLIEETGWSPFSCPDPPLVKGSSLQLSYTHFEAMATYTCDGSDVMCTGNDVIYCSNETGWDTSPGVCTKTNLDAGIGGSLADFPICPLNLGSGIELWVTPTDDKGYLGLLHNLDIILRIKLTLQTIANPLYLYHVVSGVTSRVTYPPQNPFKKGKESHILISALTDHLLIEVDGEVLYRYPVDRIIVHRAVFVESSETFLIRKAKIFPGKVVGAIREPVEDNLALNADKEASSSFANPESYGVDGNPIQAWPTGSCWNADIRDPDQWYQVDLGKQYFIRKINIDLISISGNDNLALRKETFGSPNFDTNSSQENPVNGNLVDKRFSDSCYTSSASVDDPWWMVDLGKEYTISSIAIQRRGDGYDDQHSDLSVKIYDSNPRLDANAEPEICTEKTGPWGAFEKIPCNRAVAGRYVMVKRIEGVHKGPITLCEVQVFEALASKLHDFTVNVYDENPVTEETATGRRCIKHNGEFPKDEPTTLTCVEDVWGRYVRIKADDIRDEFDQMTICEVEVYGDKIVKKEWSPHDCPAPPVQSNAFVSTSYTPDKAVANYTCFDGFATCNGLNTISCMSEAGWLEDPEPCLPRSFSAYDPSGLEIISFCPLRLGEVIELHFIPQATDAVLAFGAGRRVIFEMKWEIQSRKDVYITTDLTTDTAHPPVYVQDLPLEINKESKIVITILSYALHIDVDGVTFYVRVKSPHSIYTAWTKKAVMGKLSIFDYGAEQTELIPSKDNLALSNPTTSSSNSPTSERAVDGDLSMGWGSNSCWSAAIGDMDAWWMVKLDTLYFVSNVIITTRGNCGSDCNRRVHNFKIEMFHRDPEPKDTGDLCIKYDGVLPHASTTTLNCTEKVFGRVLRISAPDRRNQQDVFTLCEVQVFGGRVVKKVDGYRNLALFRPSTASSENKNVALAERAVDGNRHFRVLSNSCWLAAIGDLNPWWQVELDAYYYISHVEITSRVNCGELCKNAVHDLQIEVSPQNPKLGLQKELCLNYEGVFPHTTTLALKCTKKALGRYLMISSPGRTNPMDMLALCEVGVYGEEVTIEDATSTNLAEKRPASASSRNSPPQWAADGNKNMDWSGNSCWSAEEGDVNPWWMVELDDYYLVSNVEITSRSDCGNLCNNRLRNFKIEIFNKKPEPEDKGEVCVEYSGIFSHSKTEMLKCKEKVLGRFIRLSSPNRNPTNDPLTLCEFQVFGAKINRTDWTPSKCPEPPLLPNACVDVCYNKDHAVATYTCNSNYSMCTGSNVLYCNGKEGWEGTPGNCVQTTLEVHHGHVTDLQEFPICYPELGEGIEMWVTPETTGGSLAMRITTTPDSTQEPVTIAQVEGQVEINVQKLKQDPFVLKKESHLVILFLTDGLRFEVDGKLFGYSPHTTASPKISYVRSSDGLHIRMARPLKRYKEGIVRERSDENLALAKVVSAASSREATPASRLVDGSQSQLAESGCWMPNVGEQDQWVMIDLRDYYFIRELVLTNRVANNCTNCDERTRDFVVSVLPVENDNDLMKTCAVYKGVMPLGAIEKVLCKEDVWGRYVKISTAKEIRGNWDLMTFCEIEIYGDKVIQKPWTEYDCPKPSLLSDASVQLSYSPGRALATYTCNEDYTMCTGSNVLQCTSEEGWEGTLGKCQQTTLKLHYGRKNDLNEFSFCNLKLGEGLELWILPLKTGGKVSFMLGRTDNTALTLVMRPDQASERVRISTEIDGTTGNEVIVDKDLFALGREAHVTVVFISNKLLVHVDGEFLAVYHHRLETPRISYIRTSPDVNIRMFRPLPRYLDGIVRTASAENLALNKVTTASSVFGVFNHQNLVDGNTAVTTGSLCWHPAVGDKEQWTMIDLGDYYFIRELMVYNRGSSDCIDECAESTHDFAIDILPNEKVDELTTRCAFYEGILPKNAVEKIRCKEDAWGRYVRISATNVKNSQDLMTFCEVQVYGDAVVDKKVKKCPRPVQVDNGNVSFTGLFPNDVATLTCNANSKPCGSQLTARCQETVEWEKLTTCDRFRWESPEVPFLEALPCGYLDLAIYTIKATPTARKWFSIDLMIGDDILFHVGNRLKYFANENVTVFNSRLSGIWGTQEETPTDFTVGQDIVIQIRFSTSSGRYQYIVDGRTVYTFRERVNGAIPDILKIYDAVELGFVEVRYENFT